LVGAALGRKPPDVDDTAGMIGGVLGAMTGAVAATIGWGAFDIISSAGIRRERRIRKAERFGIAAVPASGGGVGVLWGRF